jgi:hypothetical protein
LPLRRYQLLSNRSADCVPFAGRLVGCEADRLRMPGSPLRELLP